MVFATDLFSSVLEQPVEVRVEDARVFTRSDTERRIFSAKSLSRCQVIDRILEKNRSATELFLAQFSDDDLRSYLDHLTIAAGRRGRDTRWSPPLTDCAPLGSTDVDAVHAA